MSKIGDFSFEKCGICGKPRKDIQVVAEIKMEVTCAYVREDDNLENMNNLAKNTREYFCETCFDALVNKIESLYVDIPSYEKCLKTSTK